MSLLIRFFSSSSFRRRITKNNNISSRRGGIRKKNTIINNYKIRIYGIIITILACFLLFFIIDLLQSDDSITTKLDTTTKKNLDDFLRRRGNSTIISRRPQLSQEEERSNNTAAFNDNERKKKKVINKNNNKDTNDNTTKEREEEDKTKNNNSNNPKKEDFTKTTNSTTTTTNSTISSLFLSTNINSSSIPIENDDKRNNKKKKKKNHDNNSNNKKNLLLSTTIMPTNNGRFCNNDECPIGHTEIHNVMDDDTHNHTSLINAMNETLQKRINKKVRDRWTTVNLTDTISFELFLRDPYRDRSISRIIDKHQEFDAYIRRIIIRCLQKSSSNEKKEKDNNNNKVFIDVGANIGYYTSIALALGARTIAIEPDFYNVAALRKTIERNNWYNNNNFQQRSTLYMNAIHYESLRITKMESTSTKYNLSNMRIVNTTCVRKNTNTTTTTTKQVSTTTYGLDYVDAVSLDQIFMFSNTTELQRVHLLKIDVEMYEFHVLNGAMYFLCNTIVERIIIEIENLKDISNDNNNCDNWPTIKFALLSMGYDIYDVLEETKYNNINDLKDIPGRDILFVLRNMMTTPLKQQQEGRSFIDNNNNNNNTCQKFRI